MATIELRLSKKVNKQTGKGEVLIRVYQGKSIDLYLKSGLYVFPKHFYYYVDLRKMRDFNLPVKQSVRLDEALKKGYPIRESGEIKFGTTEFGPECEADKATKKKLDGILKEIDEKIQNLSNDKNQTKESIYSELDKILFPGNYIEENENVVDALPVSSIFNLGELYLQKNNFSYDHTKGFRVLLRDLARYEAYRNSIERDGFKFDIDAFTKDDVEDFRFYLRDEYKLMAENPELFAKLLSEYPSEVNVVRRSPKLEERGENTIIKLMKKFKAFYKWLNDKGKTENNPFEGVGIGSEKYGAVWYITKEERNTIADFDLSSKPALEIQRDIFVFQCLVGCRVGDYMNLTRENIIDGWLIYTPHKTSDNKEPVQATVPLNERAQALLKKYSGKDPSGRLFPFISPQKYNAAIKEVLTLCGITRRVEVRNGKTGKTEIRPINEIASSHMARRTFVGSTYKVVQDPNIICKMSGHKKGSRAFSRYYEVDKELLKSVVNKID